MVAVLSPMSCYNYTPEFLKNSEVCHVLIVLASSALVSHD
ncbi:hypothetical protein PL9214290743 [Planktothrix tepida PCC 9214]|uniref:Uncharacterized protein n=1 Tax=Planktothrix tepida PCC 9214 TaxID=671072 RepID=A0A1J1LFE0_9CYAN|nr:hypothetical protein PL9214290743 [Planktothrix tepida PCC 9214]